jgi:hypothetical protein
MFPGKAKLPSFLDSSPCGALLVHLVQVRTWQNVVVGFITGIQEGTGMDPGGSQGGRVKRPCGTCTSEVVAAQSEEDQNKQEVYSACTA